MKKKLCFLLLFCLVLPVVAFFGCGTTNYYDFSYRTSGGGKCVGGGFSNYTCSGTFAEGSTVTLTATPNKGEEFLGWVYRKTNLIVDGKGGYSVSINENGEGVLQFASAQSREGQYTAVFSSTDAVTGEKLVDYVELKTFAFEKLNDDDAGVVFNLKNLDISQGSAVPPSREYSLNLGEGLDVEAGQAYNVADYSDASKVLLLTSESDESQAPKRVSANMRIGDSLYNLDAMVIYARTNSNNVTYAGGEYQVKLSFKYNEADYNLVLTYKILSREEKVEEEIPQEDLENA